ncbi:MAG: hypothetical protein M1482_07885 [Chloroflexi bacterium]|nr:hypothetical protein [Chloroflexota bacterium]
MYVAGKLKIADTRIVIANTDGTTIQELLPGSFNPAWAPDGNRIVYVSTKPNTNSSGLFVYDLAAQTATMITTDGGSNPQWSPRGDKIVYQAGGNPANVFEVNPDGSGMKQLTAGKSNDIQPTWSSDGSYVFWRSDQDGKGWAIYRMRSDGSDKRLLINDTPPDQSEKWGGRESLSAGP